MNIVAMLAAVKFLELNYSASILLKLIGYYFRTFTRTMILPLFAELT